MAKKKQKEFKKKKKELNMLEKEYLVMTKEKASTLEDSNIDFNKIA